MTRMNMKKMQIKKIIVGPIETNCYLVVSGNELAVIDPGDEADRIISGIQDLGKVNYKYILLTHGHFDHVMAVNELKGKYGFKVIVGEKDTDIQSLNAQIRIETEAILPDVTVKEGDELELGEEKIGVFATPGHTKGSVCYKISQNLFSGDTLFHRSHGRTDLPGGSDEEMGKSLDKLLKLDENIKVYPGHSNETTIKAERENYA